MALKAIDVYAILSKRIKDLSGSGSGSGSIFNESIVVNEDGEIEVITTIPTIYVNMETANLETDSNVFSVDKNGYLISSK